jgi:putative membrane protein insertion efficiency factor
MCDCNKNHSLSLTKQSQKKQNVLVKSSLGLIRFYQYFFSPRLGYVCRFFPSCSVYATEALVVHGFFKGVFLIIKRLMKCHPFHRGGFDPVPTKTRG